MVEVLHWITPLLGAGLIVVILVDALWTTISASGGGPITTGIIIAGWKIARGLFVRLGRRRNVYRVATVAIVVQTLLAWFVAMWLGWTLIFSLSADALVHQPSGKPAGVVDRFYFTAMVFLTLGTGDVLATNPGWRLLSTLASFNGLAIITITITYLVSVLSAVIEKRQLASSIGGLGATATELLDNGWNGEDFSSLEDQLRGVANRLTRHAERHLAYPILQYFHPPDSRSALPISLALLEDTTTLLVDCVDPDVQPNQTALRSLRRALDLYLKRVHLQHISSVETPPPLPDLSPLRDYGLPLRDDASCSDAFEERIDTRTLLGGILEAEGWEWPHSSDQ